MLFRVFFSQNIFQRKISCQEGGEFKNLAQQGQKGQTLQTAMEGTGAKTLNLSDEAPGKSRTLKTPCSPCSIVIIRSDVLS